MRRVAAIFSPNVKAHIRAGEDSQNNHTDGGALCDAPCSASSLDAWLDKELEISRATNALLRESNRKFKETGVYEPIDWSPLIALGVNLPNAYTSHQSSEESPDIPSDTLQTY